MKHNIFGYIFIIMGLLFLFKAIFFSAKYNGPLAADFKAWIGAILGIVGGLILLFM